MLSWGQLGCVVLAPDRRSTVLAPRRRKCHISVTRGEGKGFFFYPYVPVVRWCCASLIRTISYQTYSSMAHLLSPQLFLLETGPSEFAQRPKNWKGREGTTAGVPLVWACCSSSPGTKHSSGCRCSTIVEKARAYSAKNHRKGRAIPDEQHILVVYMYTVGVHVVFELNLGWTDKQALKPAMKMPASCTPSLVFCKRVSSFLAIRQSYTPINYVTYCALKITYFEVVNRLKCTNYLVFWMYCNSSPENFFHWLS